MSEGFSAQVGEGLPREDNPPRAAQFGRLKRYTVLGLFGFYDHRFDLDIDEPTILTGTNGTGKSTVLRTINWISQGDWPSLARIPFDRITLEYEAAELEINKTRHDTLNVRLNRPSNKAKFWEFSPQEERLFDQEYVRRFYSEAELASTEWQELELSVKDQVMRHFTSQRGDEKPGWIENISSSFPALLVSDQRLAPERRRRPKKRGIGETVDVVAAIEAAVLHINAEVQRYKSLYGTASQNLDRDFPRRVFSAINSQSQFGRQHNVARDFEEVQELRSSLAATGLIDATEIEESISDLPLDNPDSLALISTYLSDTKEKLATFEPLRRRLEPFIEFLRRHYKNKTIRIDEDHGFRIGSARTDSDISPVHLSSGEQQMFILAHKLLFESSPGTLVMIDEPELSLHVLWQSTFVDDLTEISAVSGTYFLLATHSPALIAGRTDLRRSLDG
ncbi:Predicted ATP-binding protein involved in virulence [Streptomyces sp. SceaMP-e96]|uniref:AAA family ATPase n=1 Tax=unclassified Streptomyces TaxID=2593676 RepID=UPI000823803A|nr:MULTISPECIES: AAA family ATPase [unclassified Streptomyces]MYT12184.1 AAA family ATPase [Streptomyces sp. SID4951]SCK28065.1 Predicted ATP-binding protein involved in virulence [Streptomyces sp. SceaMP-e96]